MKFRRPLHGIRQKASKGLNRHCRVLQNPDHGFKSHRRLLNESLFDYSPQSLPQLAAALILAAADAARP
jgi:hypothetical protein